MPSRSARIRGATSSPAATPKPIRNAELTITRIGTTGGDALKGAGRTVSRSVQLRQAHEGFFPRLMGKELAVA